MQNHMNMIILNAHDFTSKLNVTRLQIFIYLFIYLFSEV